MSGIHWRFGTIIEAVLKKPPERSNLSWYMELCGYITTPIVAGYCFIRLLYPTIRACDRKTIKNSPEKVKAVSDSTHSNTVVHSAIQGSSRINAESLVDYLQDEPSLIGSEADDAKIAAFSTPQKDSPAPYGFADHLLTSSTSVDTEQHSHIFHLYDTLAIKFQAAQAGDDFADRKINIFLAGVLVELLSELLRIGNMNNDLLVICEEEARYFLNELRLGVDGDLIAKKHDIFTAVVQDHGGKTFLDLGRAIALSSVLFKASSKEYIHRINSALQSALGGLKKGGKYELLRDMSLAISCTADMKDFLNNSVNILFLN